MEYLDKLGPLVIASRLKNLSDTLTHGVVRIYHEMEIDFEPRWFPLTYYLYQFGPAQVTLLAKALRQTHPAVLQVAAAMHKKGLLTINKDEKDRRKTILSLSHEGLEMAKGLEGTWMLISLAAGKLIKENYIQILEDIALLEEALDEEDIYSRIKKEYVLKHLDRMIFVPYTTQHTQEYKTINYAWLQDSVGITAHDRHIIEHPQEQVLDKGGQILMAEAGKETVATITLSPVNEHDVELSKLSVKRPYRRLGIGRKLTMYAMQRAKDAGYQSIVLMTHPMLKEAIDLYKSLGFKEVGPIPCMPDKTGRCSITMRLSLNE